MSQAKPIFDRVQNCTQLIHLFSMKPTRTLSSATTSSPRKRPRFAHSQFKPTQIATPEAAAAVDADPPLPKLLNAVDVALETPQKGKAIVYWMRMCDLRCRSIFKMNY